jgi:DNA-binding FadR family transcriptional regulator
VSTGTELATTPVRIPKTGEVVAASLRRQIVRGEIAEGDMLPSESDLMAAYGVSRPSLREALRILESEGLIVMRRGAHGGARAARPTIVAAANYMGILMQARGVTLVDVFDARVWIEPVAARLLAERRSRSAAVRTLRDLLRHELDVTSDRNLYAAATTAFHEQLVELSGNQTLSLLWATLHHVLSAEVLDVAMGEGPTPPTVARRQELCGHLLDLVEAGKGEEVEAFWRKILTRVREGVALAHGDKTVLDAQS